MPAADISDPPAQILLRRLSAFSAATLCDAGARGMSAGIRPVVAGAMLAGIADTVRILPGETLAVLQAIGDAPPGVVLVIDNGVAGATLWGGVSSFVAKRRGLAGCVTNGYVRDTDEMTAVGLPVFAAGVSVAGTQKSHGGWRGVPVAVGGVSVSPGDFVVGDNDGVVIVPRDEAETICDAATRIHRRTERLLEDLRDGTGLLDALRAAGVAA